MVLPWVKLGFLSLNAGTSATVGGLLSYCIFGGENKEERENINAIYLALEEEEKKFNIEKVQIEQEEERLLKQEQDTVAGFERVESCLRDKEAIYKEQTKSAWNRWFKEVRYGGHLCK